MNTMVSIIKDKNSAYPQKSMNPPVFYPELERLEYISETDAENNVYPMVRESLFHLGLDASHFGEESWNPFKKLVAKGQNVVIKPNLVYDNHPLGKKGVNSMVTNASIIRPIIDYVLLATELDVNISICDVPLQSTNWGKVIEDAGYNKLVSFYEQRGVEIKLLDLRKEIALKSPDEVIYKRVLAEGDPLGYTVIDLGDRSYIQEIIQDYKRLEITDYKSGTVSKHHNPHKNEYLIANTIIDCDLFINVPKLKTHKKAGLTCAMKNLVGINGDKSWIAHHRRGIDEFPSFNFWQYVRWHFSHNIKRFAPNFIKNFFFKYYKKLFLKGRSMSENNMDGGGTLMEGNWYGNDTVWRTILDLNNIIFFADKGGVMRGLQQRKYLCFVDGIIAMEKEGPMDGIPKDSGIVMAGFNPVAIDYIVSRIIGFDYEKIPQIREGLKEKFFKLSDFSLQDLSVKSNVNWGNINLQFKAPKGWKNYVEK